MTMRRLPRRPSPAAGRSTCAGLAWSISRRHRSPAARQGQGQVAVDDERRRVGGSGSSVPATRSPAPPSSTRNRRPGRRDLKPQLQSFSRPPPPHQLRRHPNDPHGAPRPIGPRRAHPGHPAHQHVTGGVDGIKVLRQVVERRHERIEQRLELVDEAACRNRLRCRCWAGCRAGSGARTPPWAQARCPRRARSGQCRTPSR